MTKTTCIAPAPSSAPVTGATPLCGAEATEERLIGGLSCPLCPRCARQIDDEQARAAQRSAVRRATRAITRAQMI